MIDIRTVPIEKLVFRDSPEGITHVLENPLTTRESNRLIVVSYDLNTDGDDFDVHTCSIEGRYDYNGDHRWDVIIKDKQALDVIKGSLGELKEKIAILERQLARQMP